MDADQMPETCAESVVRDGLYETCGKPLDDNGECEHWKEHVE